MQPAAHHALRLAAPGKLARAPLSPLHCCSSSDSLNLAARQLDYSSECSQQVGPAGIIAHGRDGLLGSQGNRQCMRRSYISNAPQMEECYSHKRMLVQSSLQSSVDAAWFSHACCGVAGSCQQESLQPRDSLPAECVNMNYRLAARELMGGEFTLSPDMVLGTKALEVKWLE
ncbi:hypothetical protein QJQ45_014718, partial [Haematococcus lacustris]